MEDPHESEPKKPDTAAAVNWVAGGRGAEVASNLESGFVAIGALAKALVSKFAVGCRGLWMWWHSGGNGRL